MHPVLLDTVDRWAWKVYIYVRGTAHPHMSKRKPTRSEICQAFGRTIRAFRKQADISQEGLAFEAGIDRSYAGGLDRGRHMPTLDTILKLSAALNVSLIDFAIEFERQLRGVIRNRKNNGQ
jgi:ribosome-binding protein aMBF1 (putative translation factor)